MLSLHYNGSNSFYLLTLQNYINSKQKTQIKQYTLCLCNISRDLIVNMKKNGLKVFSADYNAIDTNDILGIHRYLIKET